MRYTILSKIALGFLLLIVAGCYTNEELLEKEDDLKKVAEKTYKTENVIVVVVIFVLSILEVNTLEY